VIATGQRDSKKKNSNINFNRSNTLTNFNQEINTNTDIETKNVKDEDEKIMYSKQISSKTQMSNSENNETNNVYIHENTETGTNLIEKSNKKITAKKRNLKLKEINNKNSNKNSARHSRTPNSKSISQIKKILSNTNLQNLNSVIVDNSQRKINFDDIIAQTESTFNGTCPQFNTKNLKNNENNIINNNRDSDNNLLIVNQENIIEDSQSHMKTEEALLTEDVYLDLEYMKNNYKTSKEEEIGNIPSPTNDFNPKQHQRKSTEISLKKYSYVFTDVSATKINRKTNASTKNIVFSNINNNYSNNTNNRNRNNNSRINSLYNKPSIDSNAGRVNTKYSSSQFTLNYAAVFQDGGQSPQISEREKKN
jgi:hypothetical protein